MKCRNTFCFVKNKCHLKLLETDLLWIVLCAGQSAILFSDRLIRGWRKNIRVLCSANKTNGVEIGFYVCLESESFKGQIKFKGHFCFHYKMEKCFDIIFTESRGVGRLFLEKKFFVFRLDYENLTSMK